MALAEHARARVHAIVQARMGSTRSPGKVLRDLGGRPVLEWVVRAARASAGVDLVVVATTTSAIDDPIEALAARLGVAVVRGSEADVLSRFVQAIDEHPCEAVVRLTADCPLLDPALIGQVVAAWRADPSLDYVATTLVRTLPRGLDVELARADALRVLATAARGHDRVHVTSGLYADPDRFALLGVVVAPDASDLRVTLDTAEDAEALDALVAALDGGGSGSAARTAEGFGERAPAWRDLVHVLRARPDIVALNAGVRQKALEAG